MSTGRERSHNRRLPSLDDIGPGSTGQPIVPSQVAADEIAKADAEARLIEARTKAHLASMGSVGRFVGDMQRATLLGIMLLIFVALCILSVSAYFDHTHISALVEVAKALVFAGMGYLGARFSEKL